MKSIIVIFCTALLTGCIHTRETRIDQTDDMYNKIIIEKRKYYRNSPNDNSIYVTGKASARYKASTYRESAYIDARKNLKLADGENEAHNYNLSEIYTETHRYKENANIRDFIITFKAIKK